MVIIYDCRLIFAQVIIAKKTQAMKTNPLFCDPQQALCELPETKQAVSAEITPPFKSIKIIYFTDPICSTCWGIEPQLRKLKLQYGSFLQIDYRMGGLLADWSYNSGGISKPSDVAGHWDEVSAHYQMPIDGDVWIQDPLHSSYPPSVAFKAAELQGNDKAVLYLRRIREMVFLEKKNITRWEHLVDAATQVGLNTHQFKMDYETSGQERFKADLALASAFGVRGFPTIFISDGEKRQERVYGLKPYSVYENVIRELFPDAQKTEYHKDWEALFSYFSTLTAKEFSELSGLSFLGSEQLLGGLVREGKLSEFETRNGKLWKRMVSTAII